MKIIVLSSKLKEGLSAVEKAVTETSTLPILKNIYIKTSGNKIQISATNLEMGITQFVFGKIIEEGVITVPFQSLYKIVSNSDSERINLESEKNNLHIKTDNYNATIQGAPSDDFPIIPQIKNKDNYLDISTSILKESFMRVISAAQISEIRPEISGVLFDYQLTILKLVATDTFRLAEQTISEKNFKSTFEQGFKIIVPIKTIQEVMKVLPDKENVRIFTDENQVLFKTEETEVISRIIEGDYPDYGSIVPKTIKNEVVVDRAQLINAIKLVSSFSGKVNEIRVKLLENKKTIELYSASQDLGENKYLIPVKLKGQGFEGVSFNYRYVLDGLKSITGGSAFFGINGDNKPSVIKSLEDQSYFYIVMPIKA